VQGTLADAFQRLMGRNPTNAEYQAYMTLVTNYENAANTGKFETNIKLTDSQKFNDKGQVVDKTTGTPIDPSQVQTDVTDASQQNTNTQTMQNIVSQRGLGTRGAQFLAGQAAMNAPGEGNYQAATTYFNAFMKSLAGPAAGMQASGPTNTAP
jgi:hypothetical protein